MTTDLEPADNYSFQPPWINDILRALAPAEGDLTKACRMLGIQDTDQVYYQLRKQPDLRKTFDEIRWAARQPRIHRLEEQLLELAESGDIEHTRDILVAGQAPERIKITRQMRSILMLLERLDPDRWAPKPPPPTPPAELPVVRIKFQMSDRDVVDAEAIEDAEEVPALEPGDPDA